MSIDQSEYRLKVITAPLVEPVSVEDVKLSARIDTDAEDDTIALWIKSARELAEAYQRRAYIRQVLEITFDDYPITPLLLPRAPATSVDSIKYYSVDNAEATFSAVNYLVDTDAEPGRIELAYGKSWPSVALRPMAAVKIRYSAGYGTDAKAVPAAVRDAILLYCAYRNENRTAESGSIPEQFYNLLNPDRLYA